MEFDFKKRFTKERRADFVRLLKMLDHEIGFKVSSRGWCYILENRRMINKNQFDRVSDAINDCRREGLLPVDFVAEESSRAFNGVEHPSDETMEELLARMLRDVLDGSRYFTPDWWEGEKYYIQVVVEKVDLVSLFQPVCSLYHIPIANSKGWSSILQRAEYAKRFKAAEDAGLECVLLYCGDHDPDGLRISDTIKKNLEQIQDVVWGDRSGGYDPADLIIDRIGLNYDFILENDFTWIDNLITGNTAKHMDLSNPTHPNHYQDYVQNYLNNYGARKCEANAIVTAPQAAQELITFSIEKYLGENSRARFEAKSEAVAAQYATILEESGLETTIRDFLNDNG
jgi:hypothetical protein